MSQPFTTSLEDLWSEVQRTPSRVKNAEPQAAKKIEGLQLFKLEEYWRPTRTVLFMHIESGSAVGVFQEYQHRRVSGCKKWIRFDEPTIAQAVEWVGGWEMLGDRRHLFEPQRWTSEREVIVPDLTLEKIGVHSSSDVLLKVFMLYGGIGRVELTDFTRFSSPEGSILFTLPKGLNVIELMGLDQKILLRKELSK